MARLNDLIDSEAGIAAIARAAAASGDPREIAATQARITRSILEHCVRFALVLREDWSLGRIEGRIAETSR